MALFCSDNLKVCIIMLYMYVIENPGVPVRSMGLTLLDKSTNVLHGCVLPTVT